MNQASVSGVYGAAKYFELVFERPVGAREEERT